MNNYDTTTAISDLLSTIDTAFAVFSTHKVLGSDHVVPTQAAEVLMASIDSLHLMCNPMFVTNEEYDMVTAATTELNKVYSQSQEEEC